jgi:hypothetical protein
MIKYTTKEPTMDIDETKRPSNHYEYIKLDCVCVNAVVLITMGLSSTSITSSWAKTLLTLVNTDSTINKT